MAIPTPIVRELNETGILRTMAIDLSEDAEDRQAIIEVLRSKLYSDKALAPIREYATNAADSHVEAGIPDEPIKVILPTAIYPELRIRDYGIGLTPDEIEKIYCRYGRSTKRATNAQTGQLGLGCKSAFAYGDNFMVISYKDGVKTTYNLTISGVCSAIAAEPMTDEDRNGIEVVVPVNQDDVRSFQDKAVNFFKYWRICPVLSGGDVAKLDSLREELSVKPLFSEDDWEIRPNSGHDYYSDEKGIAVMGNVPYPINWGIVNSKLNFTRNEKGEVLFQFIRSNKTILRFAIGDLDFSASRESLEYTEKTCKAIVAKVEQILDSIFNILNDKIQSAASYWDALVIYNQIFGRDEEKLFAGEVYRLESYYKGKFHWKGIKIESGGFEHLERWDANTGRIDTKKQDQAMDPVLTVFHMNGMRLKQNRPNGYQNNRIPATTNNIKILIHDMEKPVLVKSMVRWLFNANPNDKPRRVYLLRFNNATAKAEFFKELNFESVPVVNASDIVEKVRAWLKANRASVGGGTPSSSIREPMNVRYITPTRRVRSYYNDVGWTRDEVDIKDEEGYYLPIEEGMAVVNGQRTEYLGMVSHAIYVLMTALGETIEPIYGIPERNRKAKWFEKAVKDEQWTNIEEYLKENEDAILYGKGALAAKAAKFFQACGNVDFHVGIKSAEKLLPLLKNKNGVMYKLCSEISSNFRDMSELIEALRYFKMGNDLVTDCAVDFESMFTEMDSTYPLLRVANFAPYIKSNDKDVSVNSDVLKMIADYVNMCDQFDSTK
jgi:hypothetical protein